MTKGSQALRKATATSNNPQDDKQTGLGAGPALEQKNSHVSQARAPPALNAGLHPMQREVQHYGARARPRNDESTANQAHEEALNSQKSVIQQLQDYGLHDRQLHDLYDGQGLSGMERFMKENSGIVYPRESEVLSTTSGFTFYRPPGSAER